MVLNELPDNLPVPEDDGAASHLEVADWPDISFSSTNQEKTNIKVVARCGCGSCPTVLFGKSLDSDSVISASELVQYVGNLMRRLKLALHLWLKIAY